MSFQEQTAQGFQYLHGQVQVLRDDTQQAFFNAEAQVNARLDEQDSAVQTYVVGQMQTHRAEMEATMAARLDAMQTKHEADMAALLARFTAPATVNVPATVSIVPSSADAEKVDFENKKHTLGIRCSISFTLLVDPVFIAYEAWFDKITGHYIQTEPYTDMGVSKYGTAIDVERHVYKEVTDPALYNRDSLEEYLRVPRQDTKTEGWYMTDHGPAYNKIPATNQRIYKYKIVNAGEGHLREVHAFMEHYKDIYPEDVDIKEYMTRE
jgi:hypothetical protein